LLNVGYIKDWELTNFLVLYQAAGFIHC